MATSRGTRGPDIAGRRPELRRLDELYRSGRAELLAVYGRRRVGKTFLVNRFFRPRCTVFEVTGIKRGGLATQLTSFATELGDVFFGGRKPEPSTSWVDAFDTLRRALAERTARSGS